MDAILFRILDRLIRTGTLTLTTASGATFTFGNGSGPSVAVRFSSRTAQRLALIDPELRLGEAYVDGGMVMEEGTITDLLNLLLSQDGSERRTLFAGALYSVRYLLRRSQQRNGARRSKRNVAHHYDLDGKLYDLFLDADRQYSCAYFDGGTDTIDEAQAAKKRHIAAKMLVPEKARVLDIGSGWGGLAIYLAEVYRANVTGITLSEEQREVANRRASEFSVADLIDFQLRDYRSMQGRFDRIVSVGMFEHVGVNDYDTYFRKCSELLSDDGVFLLHSIGRSDPPGITNPWIAKYIFPGGYIPAVSEVLPAIERAGLIVTDIEYLRLHYAETLKHWRERFLSRRCEATVLFDERFVRLWEFYLGLSEMAFRNQGMMVFQIQIAKRQASVPMTRDYIAMEEARLRSRESGERKPATV